MLGSLIVVSSNIILSLCFPAGVFLAVLLPQAPKPTATSLISLSPQKSKSTTRPSRQQHEPDATPNETCAFPKGHHAFNCIVPRVDSPLRVQQVSLTPLFVAYLTYASFSLMYVALTALIMLSLASLRTHESRPRTPTKRQTIALFLPGNHDRSLLSYFR